MKGKLHGTIAIDVRCYENQITVSLSEDDTYSGQERFPLEKLLLRSISEQGVDSQDEQVSRGWARNRARESIGMLEETRNILTIAINRIDRKLAQNRRFLEEHPPEGKSNGSKD